MPRLTETDTHDGTNSLMEAGAKHVDRWSAARNPCGYDTYPGVLWGVSKGPYKRPANVAVVVSAFRMSDLGFCGF